MIEPLDSVLFLVRSSGFIIVDGFVYFYVGAGQSGGGALISYLFKGLQGQLNVARPLGLLLGIYLQGQGSEVSITRERKVTQITLRSVLCKKKKSTVEVQVLIFFSARLIKHS